MSIKREYPSSVNITLTDSTYSGSGTVFFKPVGGSDEIEKAVTFSSGSTSVSFLAKEFPETGTYLVMGVKTDTETPTCTQSFTVISKYGGAC